MNSVIGITIATDGYFDLASEAAARFRHFGNTEAVMLTANGTNRYDLKFEILNLVGERTAVFFDSDWWAIRRFELSGFYNHASIFAVRDVSRHCVTSFCLGDALELGFPAENYVNTGLFVMNGRLSQHRAAMEEASVLMAAKQAGQYPAIKDRTEQSMLNAAWHRSGLPITYLPDEWNFWPRAQERGYYAKPIVDPVAIHAADVQADKKMQYLRDACAFYQSPFWKSTQTPK